MNEHLDHSHNPNVCPACASLFDDIQDNTIIESAIPWELESKQTEQKEPGSEKKDPPVDSSQESAWSAPQEFLKKNK